jgi:GNAT superfamily N-acetyltransferase
VAPVVRLGKPADVEAAVRVYERSALARRRGVWPHRAKRLARARTQLRSPDSWFLIAADGADVVGMAVAEPCRGDDAAGPVIPGCCFVNLVFVAPERWGEGIGGALMDGLLAEARRRGYSRIRLWTHADNERSHRLYHSRGFFPTGRTEHGEGEWAREI